VVQQIKDLKKEIDLLRSLNHVNIVKYYLFNICEDLSGVDIVLEYVPGGSIRNLLSKFGSFDENMTSIYTRQILTGLQYLHKHKVIHRDIKCANILIGVDAVIKLTDFGTSKKMKEQLED
jgi:serine/threonine protein kinase